MKRGDFATMCIKLLGLFFVVTGLYQAPEFLLSWPIGEEHPTDSFLIYGALAVMVFPVLAGVLVWAASDHLAKFILAPTESTEESQTIVSVNDTSFVTTMLVITGLVFLYNSLEPFVYSFLSYSVSESVSGGMIKRTYRIGVSNLPNDWIARTTWLIIALLSILLILRSKSIAETLLE